MSRLHSKKFDVGIAGVAVFNMAGADRYDIEVSGSVNVVNAAGDTVDTITDTSSNFYWSSGFSLVGVTAATGTVTGVESGRR